MSPTTAPEARFSRDRRVPESAYKELFHLEIDSEDITKCYFMHLLVCAYNKLPHLRRVWNYKMLSYLVQRKYRDNGVLLCTHVGLPILGSRWS